MIIAPRHTADASVIKTASLTKTFKGLSALQDQPPRARCCLRALKLPDDLVNVKDVASWSQANQASVPTVILVAFAGSGTPGAATSVAPSTRALVRAIFQSSAHVGAVGCDYSASQERVQAAGSLSASVRQVAICTSLLSILAHIHHRKPRMSGGRNMIHPAVHPQVGCHSTFATAMLSPSDFGTHVPVAGVHTMNPIIEMMRPGQARSRTEVTSLMKAIRYTKYGPPHVLRLDEIETPTPGCNDVLIRIHAAGVNAGDRVLLRGAPFMVRLTSGLRTPKHQILGADVAGQIVAVGSNVTQYQPGDEVFGDLSGSGYGAFAEYVAAPQQAVVLKPARMTFEQAAAVPSAALTALQSVREAKLQAGQQVIINGASGGVGTFAVQIARALGAEVTAVCSTRNLDMVRAIGADHVIDYTQEDYTRTGRRYDVMLDAAAYRPLRDNQRILAPGGVYVLIGGSGRQFLTVMLMGQWRSMTSGQRFRGFVKQATQQNLTFVKELLEAGSVVPVIDRRYPLGEVPEALRYLEEGHARGKVVITMEPART